MRLHGGSATTNARRPTPQPITLLVHPLEEMGARVSMSATGNPDDSAKAESFFKTLKGEEVHLKDYQTFADAEANLGQFIDDVYHTKRLHSSLGYRPPAEFEAAHTTQSMLELPWPVVW
jgi:putative transposase